MAKHQDGATTRGLWAPLIDTGRSRYFSWPDVRTTRKASREAFLDGVPGFMHREYLKNVKFVRVAIVEETP